MDDENKNKDYNLFSDDEDKNSDKNQDENNGQINNLEDDLDLENESKERPREFLNFEDEDSENEANIVTKEKDNTSGENYENEFFEKDIQEDNIVIPKSKAVLIKNLLERIIENTEMIKNIMPEIQDELHNRIGIGQLEDKIKNSENSEQEDNEPEGKIIEGVFDGQNMIGPDGKQYSVPANYASKSKLVEGDILKLTITNNGTFLYKQIGPIDRSRVVATLEKDDEGNCSAILDNKRWKILPASVSYYKGNAGDEIIILVPRVGESRWAAVENIISNRE